MSLSSRVARFACGIGLAFGVAAAPAARAAWPPPRPDVALIEVANPTDFARSQELARTGLPLPRALGVLDTASLAIVDDAGVAVPASFVVLARWDAARDDASAPIQWLLVRFPVHLDAQARRRYRLSIDGSIVNPAPAQPLQLTRVGDLVTIDSGVARFVLGSGGAALDRIELADGTPLGLASDVTTRIEGAATQGFARLRRVEIEHADALAAVVIVEGEYDHPAIGGGLISGGRRLEFSAGSGAVSVREWVDWEGARCAIGVLDCGAALNAVALEQWRVAFTPQVGAARTLSLQATLAQPGAPIALAAGASAALRQRRRAARTDVPRYELQLPAQATTSGTRADAGVAVLSGSAGSLGLAMRAMPDYEPQALRVLGDGRLVADLADDRVWLGARQGAFAEYRVGAFAPATPTATAVAALWPALNAPLIGLPAPQWIAASGATDEFPVGPLPPGLAAYDAALADLIDRTVTLRRERGLEGLMTFGLFPRNWGNPVLSDEIDCGVDPTPADDWDDPYWCAFWTDYHNTSASAVVAAWRASDPRPLHALSHPAAMRSLHTQLIRCAPDDDYFYCGQLPTGYGGYRLNFNSSHGYVENLVLHYWMTGDRTVLDRLERGARTYRGYLCATRAGA
jgi:hypothetical protein